MQENLDATKLAVGAYQKLKEIDPKNKLLKWLEPGVSDADFIEKFWDRDFPWQDRPGSMVSTLCEANYFATVKKELKEKYSVEI